MTTAFPWVQCGAVSAAWSRPASRVAVTSVGTQCPTPSFDRGPLQPSPPSEGCARSVPTSGARPADAPLESARPTADSFGRADS